MKKKFIIGLFSLLLLPCFGYCFDNGIYHNSELGLIYVQYSSDYNALYLDKNVGATCNNVNSNCSHGTLFNMCDPNYSSSGCDLYISSPNLPSCSSYYFTGVSSFKYNYSISDIANNFDDSCGFGSNLNLFDFLSNYFYLPAFGLYSGSQYYYNGNMFYYSRYSYIPFFVSYTGLFSNINFGSDVYHDIKLPVRCFSESFDISSIVGGTWVKIYSFPDGLTYDGSCKQNQLTCDQLLAGGSVQGLLTFYETDTGSYWTITTGGISCRLTNWTLSGDTVQIYSGTITVFDDYYTYTTSTGVVITTATGNNINQGTWENLLSRFSGHQLTIYETDSGTYYTFVNDSGQIVNITVDEIFTYGLSSSISGGNSVNEITPGRFYSSLSNRGFHLFTCGVKKEGNFSLRLSDYLDTASIIPKLDVNVLGFVSCPFYSLIAGLKDNFNNSTLIGEYHPILNSTGFYHKGTLENKQRLFTFFDWILIAMLVFIFGFLFNLINKKL